MSHVLILGGGLTGLSAALELQALGLPYTLIEVKPRLGGAIASEQLGGFVFDGGPLLLERYDEWPWLDVLGLRDAVRHFAPYRDGELVWLEHGTQQLTDAMTARLTGTVLTRMAASSVGAMGDAFGVCLENGILKTASAVIAAVPARFAAHLLYDLAPEAALLLDDFRYDPVARVSLGYRKASMPAALPEAGGTRLKFLHAFTMPGRVPEDGVYVRAGVRVQPGESETDWIGAVCSLIGRAEPLAAWARYWPEADPLTSRLPEFDDALRAVRAALHARVTLCGSDYGARRVDEQMAAGQSAARQVAAALA
ncbi:MAG: FAD-dependent oxidoreductase [Anaerolineae bacterium]|nr:FAD-dependent oxidoreductase [Anaerolineae bacterium]